MMKIRDVKITSKFVSWEHIKYIPNLLSDMSGSRIMFGLDEMSTDIHHATFAEDMGIKMLDFCESNTGRWSYDVESHWIDNEDSIIDDTDSDQAM